MSDLKGLLQKCDAAQIRALVAQQVNAGEDSDAVIAGSIILADLRNGETGDDAAIAAFLGLPVGAVFRVTAHLLKNRVWPLEGLDLDDGITFMLAINGGLGYNERVSNREWRLTEAGKRHIEELLAK